MGLVSCQLAISTVTVDVIHVLSPRFLLHANRGFNSEIHARLVESGPKSLKSKVVPTRERASQGKSSDFDPTAEIARQSH